MKNGLVILMAFLCLCQTTYAQTEPKTINCLRTDSNIILDGNLSETDWSSAELISGFTTWAPNPGLEPENQAEVRMIYDDDAIYIGAHLREKSREDVSIQLTQRDRIGNSDFFGIILDTYGNANDALEFIVSSAGAQFDAKLTDNGEDENWDAVWESQVSVGDDGWKVEMRIPYSAIRFTKAENQSWKLNFIRKVNRSQERSAWFPIDPEAPVWIAQMGATKGIKDITPPLRLSISPYVSTYAQNYSDAANEISSNGYSYNGGMDVKYGINDAFTLDMTLIPDFGQVQSDDQILNLSPFEVRFDEQRQFFTEGTELFNKGNLFYSRRVGGSPIGMNNAYNQLGANEEVTDNPTNSRLFNASKISGRMNNGLGIGVFNAVSRASNAVVTNSETGAERMIETAPISNYNVFVVDQSFKNNSSISLVNTNVTRFGSSYYDANVTGGQFNIKTKEQKWAIIGEAALSQKYFAESEDEFGTSYELGARKISGNLNYGLSYEQVGEKFDPNDLGFQRFGNQRSLDFNAFYGQYEQFSIFNRGNFWFNASYNRIITPNEFASVHFNTGFWMQTKSFFNINMWANYSPQSYDYFEPRIWGRYFNDVSWGNTGIWMGTDDRKKFQASGYFFVRKAQEKNRGGVATNLEIDYQASDRLSFEIQSDYEVSKRDPGFVTILDYDEIIFGRRNRSTVVNEFSANYSFTDKMNMDFRLRHYWSKVQYDEFNRLNNEGGLDATNYNEFNDFSFGLLNIDLTYRWRFAPGSDLILNWKNNISGLVSDSELDYMKRSYANGITSLSTFPENNSVSLRLVYYLDYQQASSVVKSF